MESYDIANIEDIITDWYFTNNDDMDRLGLEFVEVVKNEEDGTFDFMFNRNGHLWHLKYEFSIYFFETEHEADFGLIEMINEQVTQMDEEKGIFQEDPNSVVISILEQILIKILKDQKSGKNRIESDENFMNVDEHEEEPHDDEEHDEGEGAGWSDEEYDIHDNPELKKKSSTFDDQITRYNINLGSKDSIKIFRNMRAVLEAKEIQLLVDEHLKNYPDTFQVQIFEPLLMFKLTIDLNFLSLSPHTFQWLGFDLNELVEFLFIFDDNKILMFLDDDTIYEKDMEELAKLGIMKVEFIQQTNEFSQARYQNYLQLLHESFFSKDKKSKSYSEEFKHIEDEEMLASKSTLLEMGFGSKESDEALKSNKFSVSKAINYLLGRKKSKKVEDMKLEDDDEIISIDPKHLFFLISQ